MASTLEEIVQEVRNPRRYEALWLAIVAKYKSDGEKGRVKIAARNSALMKRIRKAVWKEKDIYTGVDKDGKLLKSQLRLHCEMDPKEGIMIFWVTKIIDEGMI